MTAKAKIILGIDEVGRGPWAGPLVVGAVVLGEEFQKLESATTGEVNSNLDDSINNQEPTEKRDYNTRSNAPNNQEFTEKLSLYHNLADSKQLSAKKRTMLAPLIEKYATASATGWVSATELDRYGLSASLKLATRRAVKQILATKIEFNEIIIDGTINFLQNTPLEDHVTLLKKADSLIKEVSAASIIAKVARDNYMVQLATEYPEYNFEKHVGYGTKAHHEALEKHGICPEHRLSFRPVAEIAKAYPNHTTTLKKKCAEKQNPTAKGKYAEQCVAEYLATLGHTIIARNFKTKTYEIDLISIKNDQIYFTEVKYRKNSDHGSSLDQITPAKLKQMHYAAEKFMSSQTTLLNAHLDPDSNQQATPPDNFQPILAVAAVSGDDYEIEDWLVLS